MEKIDNLLKESRFNNVIIQKQKWITKGFVIIPNWIILTDEISEPAKKIYIYLMTRAFKTGKTYVGVGNICKALRISKPTYQTYKKELVEKGWISIKRRGLTKTNITILLKFDY